MLIAPPEGFDAVSGIEDGWGRLAASPECDLRARTGERPSEPGDKERELTATLLDELADADEARPETAESVLAAPDLPDVPVVEASWTGTAGTVRALARVTLSPQFSGDLVTSALAVELRCSDGGGTDIDAAWAQVTPQLRVQWAPSAVEWDSTAD